MQRITTTKSIATIGSALMMLLGVIGATILMSDRSATVVVFIASGLVVILVALLFRVQFAKMESIAFRIDRQPILKTDKAVEGMAFACEGTVETDDQTILSKFTGTPCVYFHSILERWEKNDQGSGNWFVIRNDACFVPFYIRDDKSRLRVDVNNMDDDFSGYSITPMYMPDPKNSEIDCDAVLNKVEFTEKTPMEGFLGKLGFANRQKLRKSEYVLKPGTKVFVYGMVGTYGKENVIREAQNVPLIISKKTKDDYVDDFFKGSSILYYSHLIMAAGFTVAVVFAGYFMELGSSIMMPLLVGNSLIIGSIVFTMYNRIVSLRQRALNSLSNIEIELKRRADLIPNIVTSVKKYAKYEKEANRIVAEARAGIVFSNEMDKNKAPALPSLTASIENYPKLMAGESFKLLMNELMNTEERIAYSREFYNRSVLKYNTLISKFPFLLIVAPFGMKGMEYLSISRGEKSLPVAKL